MKLQKITKKSVRGKTAPKPAKKAATKPAERARHYDDACGIAHALDLVGERWALLVMRELLYGPKRFSDLRDSLPGISANVLTQRLEGLEAVGLLTRRKLPPPAASQVYELTEWGYEADIVIRTLGKWAARSPSHDPTLPVSAVSIMLSMRTMFDPARAKGFAARIGFQLEDESFIGRVADGQLDIVRGPHDGADAIFTGTARLLAAALYSGMPLALMIDKKMLTVDGDLDLAKKFVTFFPLPPKAEMPN